MWSGLAKAEPAAYSASSGADDTARKLPGESLPELRRQPGQTSAIGGSRTLHRSKVTGQTIGLVHAGDVIKGTFDYSPVAPDRTADQAIYLNAILNSRVEVYRGGSLVVTLKQGPAFFSNGNPVDQSQLSARNGDPRGLRDTINLQAGGVGGLDPADATKVVTPISLIPSHPDIIIPGWAIQFREACSSGAVAGGNCVSNDPALDYYDGSQSAVDLVKAFQHNSVHDFYLTFQYASAPAISTVTLNRRLARSIA